LLPSLSKGGRRNSGTLTPLTSARLRKNRRLGYFIVAVVALGLPGPDLYTTLLELLPMWALFESSIWLAVFVERRQPAPNEPAGEALL